MFLNLTDFIFQNLMSTKTRFGASKQSFFIFKFCSNGMRRSDLVPLPYIFETIFHISGHHQTEYLSRYIDSLRGRTVRGSSTGGSDIFSKPPERP